MSASSSSVSPVSIGAIPAGSASSAAISPHAVVARAHPSSVHAHKEVQALSFETSLAIKIYECFFRLVSVTSPFPYTPALKKNQPSSAAFLFYITESLFEVFFRKYCPSSLTECSSSSSFPPLVRIFRHMSKVIELISANNHLFKTFSQEEMLFVLLNYLFTSEGKSHSSQFNTALLKFNKENRTKEKTRDKLLQRLCKKKIFNDQWQKTLKTAYHLIDLFRKRKIAKQQIDEFLDFYKIAIRNFQIISQGFLSPPIPLSPASAPIPPELETIPISEDTLWPLIFIIYNQCRDIETRLIKSYIKASQAYKNASLAIRNDVTTTEQNYMPLVTRVAQNMIRKCNNPPCNKRDPNFKLCGRCRQVVYCSPNCQKDDWKNHKHSCHISEVHS